MGLPCCGAVFQPVLSDNAKESAEMASLSTKQTSMLYKEFMHCCRECRLNTALALMCVFCAAQTSATNFSATIRPSRCRIYGSGPRFLRARLPSRCLTSLTYRTARQSISIFSSKLFRCSTFSPRPSSSRFALS
jgi:hypothetical protein